MYHPLRPSMIPLAVLVEANVRSLLDLLDEPHEEEKLDFSLVLRLSTLHLPVFHEYLATPATVLSPTHLVDGGDVGPVRDECEAVWSREA